MIYDELLNQPPTTQQSLVHLVQATIQANMFNTALRCLSNIGRKMVLVVISIVVIVFQPFTMDSSEACTIDNESLDMVQLRCECSKAFPGTPTPTTNTEPRFSPLTAVAPKECSNVDGWLTAVVDSVVGSNESEQPIAIGKRAAIRELMSNLDIPKAICSVIHSIIRQIKQLTPIVEADVLADKSIDCVQRDRLMQVLQKHCEKDICNKAIETLRTPAFWNSAVSAQCSAFSRYYTIEEIIDLTTFYKSNVGRKFLSVQSQINHDIMEGLFREYVSEVLRNVRTETEKEVRNLLNIIG